MWDIRACRGCLAVNCKLEKLSNAAKRTFVAVTGLEIKDTDGFPKYLCTECHVQIKKSIAFRRKARRAFFVLQEIATIRKEVSYKDIAAVDRIKTNLESNLGFWKTTNRCIYSIIGPEVDDSNNEEQSINKCLKTYEPRSKKYSLHQVINIQPDNTHQKVELENIVEETQEDLEQSVDSEEVTLENDIDNNSDILVSEQTETSNIDMNDVFKDLKDDSLSDNEDLADETQKKKTKMIKKTEKIKKKIEVLNPLLDTLTNMQQYHCVKALVNSKTEFQTIVEQSNNLAIRLLREPYHSSGFKCFICLKVFENVGQLTEHAALHNFWSIGDHKCNICRTKFMESEELVIHQATNHWYKYTCNICGISEYTLFDILNHHLRHDEQNKDIKVYPGFVMIRDLKDYFNLKPLPEGELHKSIEKFTGAHTSYKCNKCNIGFKTRQRIALHMRRHNKEANPNYSQKCEVCERWFTSMSALTQHMRKWHNYQFVCKICSTVHYNRIQARHHLMSHQSKKEKSSSVEDNKEQKCLECGRSFITEIGLVRHMHLKHHKIIWTEHCNVCGKAFVKPTQLYSHQLQVHKYISLNHKRIGSEEFLCKKCDVYFVNEQAYQNHVHLVGHEEAKQLSLCERFACTKCKKAFKTQQRLSKHSMSCAKYPKKCSYCDAILENFMEYKLHYIKVHPDLQYKPTRGTLCELCGKSVPIFGLKIHLQKHSDMHNTFSCNYCKRECATSTQLLVHIVSVHTWRPYICGICDKRLRDRQACREHILKVHAPVKPFKCRSCDRNFSDLKLLQRHSIVIHGEVNEIPKRQINKAKGKLFLYPNMKIDVSLVDPKLIDNIDAELCDYLNKKSKPVKDIQNYFVRNQGVDVQNYIKFKVKKRKIRDISVSNTKKQKSADGTISVIANSKLINDEAVIDDTELEENIELLEYDESCIDTHGQMDVVLEDTSESVQIDESELEIIEKDGEQYVNLDGVFYRVEQSEE